VYQTTVVLVIAMDSLTEKESLATRSTTVGISKLSRANAFVFRKCHFASMALMSLPVTGFRN
jgi:hypothetical protein